MSSEPGYSCAPPARVVDSERLLSGSELFALSPALPPPVQPAPTPSRHRTARTARPPPAPPRAPPPSRRRPWRPGPLSLVCLACPSTLPPPTSSHAHLPQPFPPPAPPSTPSLLVHQYTHYPPMPPLRPAGKTYTPSTSGDTDDDGASAASSATASSGDGSAPPKHLRATGTARRVWHEVKSGLNFYRCVVARAACWRARLLRLGTERVAGLAGRDGRVAGSCWARQGKQRPTSG